jgi:valyl-tRNA synthetase
MREKTMKKLLILLIALAAFALGIFAVELSPPKAEQPCVSVKTEKSVIAADLGNVQDNAAVQNKLIEFQNLKAIVSNIRELKANGTTNSNKKAKTGHKTFDLPPNFNNGKEGFTGNVANKIRADTNEI